MRNKSIYVITYVRDGKEYVEEVPAYSEDQARYLIPCDIDEIVDIELSVCNLSIETGTT